MHRIRPGAAAALLVASLVACGSEEPPAASGNMGTHSHGHSHGGSGSGFAFGEPGKASEANRSIEVTATDKLRFDPDMISVEEGETVTFEITNKGRAEHEFVLGDTEYQRSHADQMAAGQMHNHGANAVPLPPGESAEMTWTFSTSGTVVFACHVNGHFQAGMLGGIVVR